MNSINFMLDLDGLGSDWQGYVLNTHFPHLTIDELNKAANRSVLLREMYTKDPHVFYKLPVIDKYKRIIDALNASGAEWKILTSAGTDHPDYELVVSDKLRYVKEHFGVGPEKVIITRSSFEKAQYAAPNVVLFDDFFRNCEEWSENGGIGVHVETTDYDADELIDTILAFTEQ